MSDEGGKIANAARAEREHELLRRYHVDGDQAAKDQLAEEMLPLARALAGRYSGRGEPLDDLVQVACIGIMKAIEGFDLDRDVRFSSYATPTVLGEIKRHFRDRTWAMRVPRGMQELQLKIAKARDKLTSQLGRSPTVQELAEGRRRAVRGGAPDAAVGRRASDALARRADRRRSRHEPRRRDRRRRPGDAAHRDARAARRRDGGPLRLATARCCACASRRTSTQTEISSRIGVSQMQISRIIRQSLVRLRMDIERERSPKVA